MEKIKNKISKKFFLIKSRPNNNAVHLYFLFEVFLINRATQYQKIFRLFHGVYIRFQL